MDTQFESSHSLNILIVDDNEDAADTLEVILRVWGYNVRVAYNGEKGFEAATAAPPDCVLLDINMPTMNGYDVAEKIRKRPAMQGVKLVALTACSDEKSIRKMAQVGFNYYLSKNCTLSEIRNLLETYSEKMGVRVDSGNGERTRMPASAPWPPKT
jgi:CheY-like chemotaxis protein